MSDIQERYISANQAHLFASFEDLTNGERKRLLSQLEQIPDPSKYLQEVQEAIRYSTSVSKSRRFSPLPAQACASTLDTSSETLKEWNDVGMDLIAKGKVGVILMAGGQGSRLGSAAPKGCYNVGLPSQKSLFQLQAERLKKLQQLANTQRVIPLYVMTSKPTRTATENFFTKNNYFGLESSQVIFFDQGTLPAVSLDGTKLLLESKSSLIESPDGNGGLYKAIYDNGLLQDFAKRGIEHIHMYCVDNVLVKVGDPIFIGYASTNKYHIATKVVRKRTADESVGLIVMDEETRHPAVIEYSEVSQELREKRDPQGLLFFRAANIVNHYYNVAFLQEMIPKWISDRRFLPYHVARKKIAYLDVGSGKIVEPREPNGIKLEQFIFDVFSSVEMHKFGCLEVDRAEEFSPLKNAPGSANDGPETCKANLLSRSARWLTKAGAILLGSEIEVSPLTSYSGEGLEKYLGSRIGSPAVV
ncbi:hypothetical protein KL905_001375 [Ogataea polymorpha]|nr:hypothetical protein KL937_002766 [Ogataea polymorpha]KAG7896968.1 hypothetical protein KL908_000370 [Ogataea polymorpha]KAG7912167.1 hypothetical protein KL906_000371 [Ogataea polymorpha]KAG7913261.1 hypothetical protein KL907_000206 [Ogataea polymorpha]KAG7920069.1 hypothetical protein KL927_000749 [Ogataea polymorpha]